MDTPAHSTPEFTAIVFYRRGDPLRNDSSVSTLSIEKVDPRVVESAAWLAQHARERGRSIPELTVRLGDE